MEANINSQLLNMGFTQNEINYYEYVVSNNGKITPQDLQSYGLSFGEAKRLTYMKKILTGAVSIQSESDMITHVKNMTGTSRQNAKDYVYQQNLMNGYAQNNYSKDELIKHLKETNGRKRKISIQDLKVSTVTTVPNVAVVAGINIEPFTIWNSKQYSGKDMLYPVAKVSGQNITIETSKKPKLEYGQNKEIPGMLKILGVRNNGHVVVTFNRKYCALCNRYIIVASLRNPQFHLGKHEIVCFEGTKIYVYAVNMGTRDKVGYAGGNKRIYAYGIFPGDIRSKLDNVAKRIYGQLGGVCSAYYEANSGYSIIDKEKKEDIPNVEV